MPSQLLISTTRSSGSAPTTQCRDRRRLGPQHGGAQRHVPHKTGGLQQRHLGRGEAPLRTDEERHTT
jgi:hypothetical protein